MLWDHSFFICAPDKQINEQTESKILLTPTDIVGVCNEHYKNLQTTIENVDDNDDDEIITLPTSVSSIMHYEMMDGVCLSVRLSVCRVP